MSSVREPTIEEIIAMGFKSYLREHDAVCDLRKQYEYFYKGVRDKISEKIQHQQTQRLR